MIVGGVKRPILPNSPLVEVAVEFRFPGELRLLSRWAAVQAELRGAFPKLFVPAVIPGTAPLLQHLQLSNDDRSHIVLLAVNSFGLATKKYKDFEWFRTEFRRAYDGFQKHAEIGHFTRLGLRYVNALPPEFPGTRLPGQLHPCLRLRIEGWEGLPREPNTPTTFVYNGSVGGLTLRTALQETGPELVVGESAELVAPGIRLDLDCFQTGRCPADRVPEFVEEAHRVIEDAFFGLITSEYERYLRGEQ